MGEEDHLVPPGIDINTPNVARVYDASLGGKNNYGVGQIVDIGSGLPTVGNVHEVAHEVDPATRVVYVDNDPIVLVHNRALPDGVDNATTILGDFNEPEEILANAELRSLIDFDQPVAVLLIAILHHFTDEQRPFEIVARLRDALPSGSYMAAAQGVYREDQNERSDWYTEVLSEFGFTLRVPREIDRFFVGFELVEPGMATLTGWRPDPGEPIHPDIEDAGAWGYGGVGRKP
jgi:hypothetical protein